MGVHPIFSYFQMPYTGLVFELPLVQRLAGKQSILIAGAGGGFDIYSGLPLYFALRKQGRKVHLANLTFTALEVVSGCQTPLTGLVRVASGSHCAHFYFPEGALSRWFKQRHGEEIPVWCFEKTGVAPLAERYQYLVDELNLDAIILVDGGVDSLLRGDEKHLGTPSEDMASLAAVSLLRGPQKILACIATGAEKVDEIDHGQVLENVAALTREGGFLGSIGLSKEMSEVQEFIDAGKCGLKNTEPRGSVIVASLISALEGHFGDHHVLERTKGNELWINPLMPIFWFFDADCVVRRNLYLPQLMGTMKMSHVTGIIRVYRETFPRRPGGNIPI
jgi:hypothetical protein